MEFKDFVKTTTEKCHKCNGIGRMGHEERTSSYESEFIDLGECKLCKGSGEIVTHKFSPVIYEAKVKIKE